MKSINKHSEIQKDRKAESAFVFDIPTEINLVRYLTFEIVPMSSYLVTATYDMVQERLNLGCTNFVCKYFSTRIVVSLVFLTESLREAIQTIPDHNSSICAFIPNPSEPVRIRVKLMFFNSTHENTPQTAEKGDTIKNDHFFKEEVTLCQTRHEFCIFKKIVSF